MKVIISRSEIKVCNSDQRWSFWCRKSGFGCGQESIYANSIPTEVKHVDPRGSIFVKDPVNGGYYQYPDRDGEYSYAPNYVAC